MNELFVTTARVGMDSAALKKYPQAGGVFRMETNTTGTPTYEFGA
jgi:sugar lactone lactonase YvrE